MSTILEKSIVSVDHGDGNIEGTGFLVSPQYILTCAHVVKAILKSEDVEILKNLSEKKPIILDITFMISKARYETQLVRYIPLIEVNSDASAEDIALLKVISINEKDSKNISPLSTKDMNNIEIQSFGFSSHKRDDGNWIIGIAAGMTNNGLIQINLTDQKNYANTGYSGAPIWDKEDAGVIGMMKAIDKNDWQPYMIPAKTIIKALPQLSEEIQKQNPYKGLESFKTEDKKYFFGRSEESEKIAKELLASRVYPLYGASGSGKSSLIFAGIVPLLQQEKQIKIIDFRPSKPSSDIFENLVMSFIDLYNKKEGEDIDDIIINIKNKNKKLVSYFRDILHKAKFNHLVIIIDQFEELYTLSKKENTIKHIFLDQLLSVITTRDDVSILISIRADFLTDFLEYEPFSKVIDESHDKKLGPIGDTLIKDIIEKPASIHHVTFQEGLVDTLIEQFKETDLKLPLLEFTLHKLWEHMKYRTITFESLDKIGGISGSLTNYADDIKNSLKEEEQEYVKKVLIKLIRPGSGTEDTRKVQKLSEFTEEEKQILNKLAKSRLITIGEKKPEQKEENEEEEKKPLNNLRKASLLNDVEITHEILIREWNTLRDWINDNREFLVWKDKVEVDQKAYKEGTGDLLSRKKLVEAKEFLESHEDDLTDDIKEYIQKSIKRHRFIFISMLIALIIVASLSIAQIIALDRANIAEQNHHRTAYFNTIDLIDDARAQGDFTTMVSLLNQVQNNDRGWEWKRLKSVENKGKRYKNYFTDIERTAVSENGNWFAVSGKKNGQLETIFWHKGEFAQKHSVPCTNYGTEILEFSTDENYLFIGKKENKSQISKLCMIDVDSGNTLINVTSGKKLVLFDKKSANVITLQHHEDTENDQITVYRKPFNSKPSHFNIPKNTKHLFMSSDGGQLLSVHSAELDMPSQIQLWDLKSGKYLSKPTSINVGLNSVYDGYNNNFIWASLDLKYLIGSNNEGHLTAWRTVDGKTRTLFDEKIDLNYSKFSSKGSLVVAFNKINGGNSKVLIYKTLQDEPVDITLSSAIEDNPLPINGEDPEPIIFSPDGNYIVISQGSKLPKMSSRYLVYKSDTGEKTIELEGDLNTGTPLQVSFLSNDLLLSSSPKLELSVIDMATGRTTNTLLGHENGSHNWVNALATSSNGLSAISTDTNGTIITWELKQEEAQALTVNIPRINTLAWDNNGSSLYLGGKGNSTNRDQKDGPGIIQILNTNSLQIRQTNNILPLSVRGLIRVGAKNDILARDDFDGLVIWNHTNQDDNNMLVKLDANTTDADYVELPSSHYSYGFEPYAFAFRGLDCNPSGSLCAASSSRDGSVRFWAPYIRKEKFAWKAFKGKAIALRFTPTENQIVAVSIDNQIKLWDINRQKEVWTIINEKKTANCLAIDPKSRWFAVGYENGDIAMYNLDDGLKLYETSAHISKVTAIEFEPTEGERFATASNDKNIKIWDSSLGIEAITLRGHQYGVQALGFDPSGNMLASLDIDGTIKIWSTFLDN